MLYSLKMVIMVFNRSIDFNVKWVCGNPWVNVLPRDSPVSESGLDGLILIYCDWTRIIQVRVYAIRKKTRENAAWD